MCKQMYGHVVTDCLLPKNMCGHPSVFNTLSVTAHFSLVRKYFHVVHGAHLNTKIRCAPTHLRRLFKLALWQTDTKLCLTEKRAAQTYNPTSKQHADNISVNCVFRVMQAH